MVCALGVAIRSVGNCPVALLEQRGGRTPVPDALGPIGVSRVPGITSQTSGELKQTAVGNGVFGRVASLVRPDLPAHTTVATAGIPARNLGIEHTLGQRDPRGLTGLFGEVELGSGHCSETPEDLVIVSEVLRVVGREVVVLALLPVHARLDEGVELAVARQPPVLDHGHEHRTTLPPRAIELSRDGLRGAIIVVCDHVGDDRLRRRLEGI